MTADQPKGTGQPTLWAISDLHVGHTGNKPVAESLFP
ncbi:MAG TPA: metallophosphoesterase, partial [Mycobacterium sp.]|nr:metallophosphoesterase [Mycobacterium sp.]